MTDLERKLMDLPVIPWWWQVLLQLGLLVPTVRWMSRKYIDECVDARLEQKMEPLHIALAKMEKIANDVAYIRGQLSRRHGDDE